MPSVGFSLTIHNGKGKPMTTALTTDLGQLTETLDSLLAYVNRCCAIVRPSSEDDSPDDLLMKRQLVQRYLWDHTTLIDDYVRANPDHLGTADLAVAADLAGTLYGTFCLLDRRPHEATVMHHTGIYVVEVPDDSLLPQAPMPHAELRGALAPYHGTIVPIPPFLLMGASDPGRIDALRNKLAGDGTNAPIGDPKVLATRAKQQPTLGGGQHPQPTRDAEPLPAGPGFHCRPLAGLGGEARREAAAAHHDQDLLQSGWHQRIMEARCLDVSDMPVTLEDALALLDDEWLEDIAFEMRIMSDADEPTREQLIGLICEHLASDHEAACLALMWCPDNQFRLVDLLMGVDQLSLDSLSPSEVLQLHPLAPYVFMLSEKGAHLAWMAPEVRAVLSTINLDRLRSARRRLAEVRSTARGMATMCGVIRASQVYDRYRRQATDPLNRHQFDIALREQQGDDQRDDYMLWDHLDRTYVVATEISDASAPMRVARESYTHNIVDCEALGSSESPLVVGLSEDEEDAFGKAVAQKEAELERIRCGLLAHDRHLAPPELPAAMLQMEPIQALCELDALQALRSFVDAHVPDGEDDYTFADTFVRSVVVSATLMAESYNETMDLIRLYHMEGCEGTDFSDSLGRLVTNAYNALPRWELNGWSLEQNTERLTGRRRFFAPDGTVRALAKDDPCPCGSGKAYGRCCGNLT